MLCARLPHRATRRQCYRYRIVLLVSAVLILIQTVLAWSFYDLYLGEVRSLLDKSDVSRPRDHVMESFRRNAREYVQQDVEEEALTFRPVCQITQSEAVSALRRARTAKCKQLIADVVCNITRPGSTYYPQSITPKCPTREEHVRGQYLGCYQDDRQERLLGDHSMQLAGLTPESCSSYCLLGGYRFAGLQWGRECWCGRQFNPPGDVIREDACGSPCPGAAAHRCGGYLTMSVYSTGLGREPALHAPALLPGMLNTTRPLVRIAFILSVTGRAVRQVNRLFKAIYHEDHVYLFHVDARQDYLHREVKALAARFNNVYVTPWRLATIWGGASLLTMLLRSMRDLASAGLKWDYVINLSESCYPLQPQRQLREYLTYYQGYSFVRSHGKNTHRFIKKQGLDRTFVECESRMWRVGERSLPRDMRVDGGSDWIALHRTFVDYLIQQPPEPLIADLLRVWSRSLLPAETFFHTALRNSRFCPGLVNNNLRLTNWNRKRGCKCQHKAVVDWCGCSPNDFMPSDLPMLLNRLTERPLFFARKFESAVNQEVLNGLDQALHGSFPADMPAVHSYWHNEYHHLDDQPAPRDEDRTLFAAFARLGARSVSSPADLRRGCGVRPGDVTQVHTYRSQDTFQGYVVRYHGTAGNDAVVMETFVKPRDAWRKLGAGDGPGARLELLQVGNRYDPKELLFRNEGALFGVHSNLDFRFRFAPGEEEVRAVFVTSDPAGVIALQTDVTVPAEGLSGHVGMALRRPLLPGVWSLRAIAAWRLIAELKFTVSPLTYLHGHSVSDVDPERLKVTHSGPPSGVYGNSTYRSMYRWLGEVPGALQAERRTALGRAGRTGTRLREWVDQLAGEGWAVADTCVLSRPAGNSCENYDNCLNRGWSAASWDPKSEVGAVDPATGQVYP